MRRSFADLWLGMLKSLTRINSFISKEVVEVVRRPGTLLSLVLGPFLIMALFGFGYGGQRRPLDTVIVLPADSTLPHDLAAYQEYGGLAVRVDQITEDLEAARERLRREEIDLLVIAPADVDKRFIQGQQSELRVEYNQIDPLRDNYMRFVAYRQVQELNRAIIQMAAQQGQEYVVQRTGDTEVKKIPPEVLAAPLKAETHNWAPTNPDVVRFYAPAVLALVMQHMAITLTALSMVRERLSGAFDLFRVAPLRSVEILVGKYLAYGFLNMAIGAIVSFLLVGVLGVPLLGQPIWFAAIVLLLTFASLGLGLLISVLANTERQAVQLSMLVLLASVFFSGFVLPLDEFFPQVRYLAYALPVTHGIKLLQDFMLRGGTYAIWQVWTLALVGALLFLLTGLSLRRAMARA